MNKDIIYIDVEDDVTSVIGKVRDAKEKIVALVPPKNIGALQSAVNLRLLQKAADGAGKRIVLITNNSGLTALAAGVKIPVAKNLQSKPEIPTLPDRPEAADEDVIKGEELPVGELAAAAVMTTQAPELAGALALGSAAPKKSDDDIDAGELPDLAAPVTVTTTAAAVTRPKPKTSRVPNFGRFRKAIFIGGGAIVAIILFFVLTNIFLTGASVVITAQTSDEPVDLPITLTADGSTNPDQSTLKAESKQLKKTASVDFTPTGKKNEGNKATGTVKFSTNSISNLGTTIPAGTELTTSSGAVFTTDSAVTITTGNYQNAPTSITAQDPGTINNGATGNMSGAPSGISATLVGATANGTDKNVTVVTADDVAAATAKLTASDAGSAKTALSSQFGDNYLVIGDSFNAQDGTPSSAPAVGSDATTAKLSRDSTYTLYAINKDQIKILTAASLNGKLDDNQKIYSDGSSSATVAQFVTSPSGVMTAHIRATGKVGPNIDESALKSQLVGKKAGEITGEIQAINGVKDVNVSLSPFWRTTAPSADKIKISFDLNGSNE